MSFDETSWIVRAPGDFERFEACLDGAAYGPHRHDTYAIAITVAGVQSFSYRGSRRHSLPGQIVVLHPDELHDGHAGDGRHFRYRSASVAPSALQEALGGRALPFLAGGVSDDARLFAAAARGPEGQEGTMAFIEKRLPSWAEPAAAGRAPTGTKD